MIVLSFLILEAQEEWGLSGFAASALGSIVFVVRTRDGREGGADRPGLGGRRTAHGGAPRGPGRGRGARPGHVDRADVLWRAGRQKGPPHRLLIVHAVHPGVRPGQRVLWILRGSARDAFAGRRRRGRCVSASMVGRHRHALPTLTDRGGMRRCARPPTPGAGVAFTMYSEFLPIDKRGVYVPSPAAPGGRGRGHSRRRRRAGGRAGGGGGPLGDAYPADRSYLIYFEVFWTVGALIGAGIAWYAPGRVWALKVRMPFLSLTRHRWRRAPGPIMRPLSGRRCPPSGGRGCSGSPPCRR